MTAGAQAALAAAAVYFALFGGEYGAGEIRAMERHAETLEARVAEMRGAVDSLRAWADRLERDPATLERVARERYGMIRDGEVLYRFVEPSALDSPWDRR